MGIKIIIFGGSGFIGSNLTQELVKEFDEVKIICRDLNKAKKLFDKNKILSRKNLIIESFDIFDEKKLKKELINYQIIINLIGKLYEAKKGDFTRYHDNFPKILAKNITNKQKIIHISALGIDQSKISSKYAFTKISGEENIKKYAKNYNIIRPSIVFGKNDNFFNLFAKISKYSPFLPLIGGAKNKFAPIYVNDLVKAIIILAKNDIKYKNKIIQAAGPVEVSFKDLLKFILKNTNRKRFLINLPFNIAKIQAKLMNIINIYLVTCDQIELLKYDNISDKKYDNIDKLDIKLTNYNKVVPQFLKNT